MDRQTELLMEIGNRRFWGRPDSCELVILHESGKLKGFWHPKYGYIDSYPLAAVYDDDYREEYLRRLTETSKKLKDFIKASNFRVVIAKHSHTCTLVEEI